MHSLPNIKEIVAPLVGLPYEHFQLSGPSGTSNACWGLVRHVLKEGFGFDLVSDATSAAERFAEIWHRADARDPWTLLQPWDALVFITRGHYTDHVGLIVEPTVMIHCRKRVGVCLEPIQRWRAKVFQIVRLRKAF